MLRLALGGAPSPDDALVGAALGAALRPQAVSKTKTNAVRRSIARCYFFDLDLMPPLGRASGTNSGFDQ